MKKRILSLLLTVLLLLGAMPAAAGAQGGYGSAAIYLGYPEADYMAEELLKEIGVAGKSPREQIAAVYDWMQKNCLRTGSASQKYFDPEKLEEPIQAFSEQMTRDLAQGTVTLRLDLAAEQTQTDPVWGMQLVPYDSNLYIAQFASQMMIYRVGTCAHFAALLTLLLSHLGYDCRLIDGEFINSDGTRVEHKWNMVLLDGQYLWLDPRMDQANYSRTGQLSRTYYLIQDTAEWEKKHSWDHAYSDGLMACAAEVEKSYETLLQVPGKVEDILEGQQPWSRCSNWAKPYLETAVEQGLYPAELVFADLTQDISRGEFAAVAVQLYQALTGEEAPAYTGEELPFSDVTWDDGAILSAFRLGVVQGSGKGKFDPHGPLSREAAVTMLGRVCELVSRGEITGGGELERGSVTLPDFSDRSEIGGWAAPYVDYFVSRGVVNGIGGAFVPKQNMSREQALKVASQALEQLAPAEGDS